MNIYTDSTGLDGIEDEYYSNIDSVIGKDIDGDNEDELCFYAKHKNGNTYTSIINFNAFDLSAYPNYFEYNLIREDSVVNIDKALFKGDFNGDGNLDMIEITPSNIKLSLYDKKQYIMVTTFPLYEPVNFSLLDSNKESILIDDFNGDGKDDILHYYISNTSSTARYAVYFSNGINFKKEEFIVPDRLRNYVPILSSDYNNDGNADITVDSSTSTSYNSYILYFLPQNQNFLLTKIKDGYEKTIQFIYTHFSSLKKNYYSSINSFVYETTPVSFVVTSVVTPDGSGDMTRTITQSYTYDNALFHKQLGFLGFKYRTQINNSTQIKLEFFDTLINANGQFYLVQYSNVLSDNSTYIFLRNDTIIKPRYNYEQGVICITNACSHTTFELSGYDTLITPVKTPKLLQYSKSYYQLTTYPNKRYWLKPIANASDNFVNDIHTTSSMLFDANGNITATYDTLRGGHQRIADFFHFCKQLFEQWLLDSLSARHRNKHYAL